MCSFAAKWKAVNDTANRQNEDGTYKVKKKNTFYSVASQCLTMFFVLVDIL